MAEHEVKVPKMGMSMTDATIGEWLVATGEEVSEGQTVATIETDKVDAEIEASAAGKIQILVEAGETVDVGTVLASISS